MAFACNPNLPANPDVVSTSIDCCRIQFLNAEGEILFEVNLTDLTIKRSTSDALILQDGTNTRPFTNADAVNLGYADLAAFEAYILAQRALCCEEIDTEYEVVCVEENDNLYIIVIEDGVITVQDFNGNDVTGTVTPTACVDVTYDTEKEFFCVDGVDYTRNDCIKKDKDGTFLEVNSFWQDITGTVVPEPTGTKTRGACEICTPTTESFLGDNATLTEFNEITIDIPKCCAVSFTTNAGTINLPSKNSNWIFCQKYDCNLTSFSLSASTQECLDETFVILTKTK